MTDPRREEVLRELIASRENHCFGCSPHNERGLRLEMLERDGWMTCAFAPEAWQQGWQEVVHGGILAAVLDEVMGAALYYRGWKCVTARMEIRYRLAARQGDHLRARARVVRETRRAADLEAQIVREDTVVTEAFARFVKLGPVLSDGDSVQR